MSRKIDALVAKHIFKFTSITGAGIDNSGGPLQGFPPESNDIFIIKVRIKKYSTDIAAAWEVLDFLSDNDVSWELDKVFDGNVFCIIRFAHDTGESQFEADSKTAPMSICLAALKAMGVEVGDE